MSKGTKANQDSKMLSSINKYILFLSVTNVQYRASVDSIKKSNAAMKDELVKDRILRSFIIYRTQK